jgi:phage shock protein A
MDSQQRPGFFARLGSLLRGLGFGWVRDREERNPKAVYEQAIQQRLGQYRALKDAVAGILYTRNKLEAELAERRHELERTLEDIRRALGRSDDAAGLALVQHKQNVQADVERVEREVETLRDEAEDAKRNLMRFREEIKNLETEKGRMLAALASARARRRMHEALDGLSVEADVQALENVRMYVQRSVAAASLERELGAGDETTQRIRALRREAIAEGARREFEELKKLHGTHNVAALSGREITVAAAGHA